MSLKAASSFLAARVNLCQHVRPFPKAAVPAPHSPPFYTLTDHNGPAACFGSGETVPAFVGTFNQYPDLTIPTLTSLALGQSVTVAVRFANPSGGTNFTAEVYAGSFQ
jgi:hypothetical protein